jgi:hypothetical protein
MTVNGAVGPRHLRDDLVRAFCRAPHVQAVPRRWPEKGDYSHFAVLHCASRPAMPLADHSPLTERSRGSLLVAARETLLDAVMELRCLQLPHHRCLVGHDHRCADSALWHYGSHSRTRYLPGVGGVGLTLNGPAGGAHAPRIAKAVNLWDREPFLSGMPSRHA